MNSAEFEMLFTAAETARNNSHAPYSKYNIGAAVLADDGRVFAGCNVENASYGATVCAERVAIWKAVSEGSKKIKSLLVLADAKTPWPPCGLCRQVIVEFAFADTQVYMANLQKTVQTASLSQLVPFAFSPDCLKT